MKLIKSALNLPIISSVRRNHALEHATLQVINRHKPQLHLAGYSDPGGFHLIGDATLEEIQSAAEEALFRLKNGEEGLAIHPNCGTNFLVSGMAAGLFAWLGMLGVGDSLKKKMDRLSWVITLATFGMIVAQPYGPLVQKNITTCSKPGGLHIKQISVNHQGNVSIFRVSTGG